jgi:AbiU2
MPSVQEQYELRLKRYARLINAPNDRGLIAKLQIFRSFLEKKRSLGDKLWRIEPLLMYLLPSLEMDVHLTIAKFFEDDGYGVDAFLRFCLSNHRNIQWAEGNIPTEVLFGQRQALAAHSDAVESIKRRRNKIYAHMDKEYQDAPEQAFVDFPLEEDEVLRLAQCLIDIVAAHQRGLQGAVSFHLAETFDISVDNMVRNLETGRRHNFPGQNLD